MTSYLVMLQTNSNQSFIFSSPRLREQIGASFEITLLSKWVKDKAEELLDTKTLPSSFWVSDSSGKVIVRFTEADGYPTDLAKRLIREVTLRALTDAPGLDVTGVFIETSSDPVDPTDLNRLDRAFSEYSLNRRPAAARFPQFPFLERGSESALPASASLHDLNLIQEPLKPNDFGESSPLSLPSRVKRALATTSREQQVKDVQNRLKKLGKSLEQEPQLNPTKLAAAFQDGEESEDAKDMLSSVGVVHIDGNGVGAIMRDLKRAHDAVKKIANKRRDMTIVSGIDDFRSFIMSVNKRLDDVVKDAIALSWYDVQELTPTFWTARWAHPRSRMIAPTPLPSIWTTPTDDNMSLASSNSSPSWNAAASLVGSSEGSCLSSFPRFASRSFTSSTCCFRDIDANARFTRDGRDKGEDSSKLFRCRDS